ncbi:MAG: hypothetical protein GY913_22455 [Proteobacteria bacterium]|nr:hypothetical protein [Pseudomonadota bacterium]MCP4919672.1 hypothetical protein [Pseudomonadota bacterium]
MATLILLLACIGADSGDSGDSTPLCSRQVEELHVFSSSELAEELEDVSSIHELWLSVFQDDSELPDLGCVETIDFVSVRDVDLVTLDLAQPAVQNVEVQTAPGLVQVIGPVDRLSLWGLLEVMGGTGRSRSTRRPRSRSWLKRRPRWSSPTTRWARS